MKFVGEYLGHTTNFEPIQDVEHLQSLEFDGVVGLISDGLPRGYPYMIFSSFFFVEYGNKNVVATYNTIDDTWVIIQISYLKYPCHYSIACSRLQHKGSDDSKQ